MRERLRDKERLVHILTSIDNLIDPEAPWDKMEGMRHVLVHGYFLISPPKVWNVINNDLPTLRPLIERYIAEESAA